MRNAPSKTMQPAAASDCSTVEAASSKGKQPAVVSEAKRIANLVDKPATLNKVDLSGLYKPDCPFNLLPIQEAALREAALARGLLAFIGAGGGKTLVTGLLPTLLGSERAVLFVPASLVTKTELELKDWSNYFYVDLSVITIMSYERFSRQSGYSDFLEISPDLIICDEAHYLKDLGSARTKRLGGYIEEQGDDLMVCMLSGTLLNKSVSNVAHLSAWCLMEGSPFPLDFRTVAEWDEVLSGNADKFKWGRFKPLLDKYKVNDPREALNLRLSSCPGIVLSNKDSVAASLNITLLKPDVPKDLSKNIKLFCEDGVVEELSDMFGGVMQDIQASSHLWEDDRALLVLGQLYSGFIYYWDWPDNIVDTQWLEARRSWMKVCRRLLAMEIPGFDTPMLVEQEFDKLPPDIIRRVEPAYHAWFSSDLYKRATPPKKAAWVSSYLIDYIKDFYEVQQRKAPMLIWVNLTELGYALSEALNIAFIGGGEDIPAYEGQSLILSVKAHGTGKNLQDWHTCLVAALIADPSTWEQLLARTHRTGQQADEVNWYIIGSSVFGGGYARASSMAKLIGQVTGKPQRLNYATKITP